MFNTTLSVTSRRLIFKDDDRKATTLRTKKAEKRIFPKHLWEMTWSDILDAVEARHPLTSYDGYLIFSRDRVFQPSAARLHHHRALRYAAQRSFPVPAHVKAEHPEIFALRELPEATLG